MNALQLPLWFWAVAIVVMIFVVITEIRFRRQIKSEDEVKGGK